MDTTDACKWCGEWFIKKTHNQKYCSKACSRMAEKHLDKQRAAKRRMLKKCEPVKTSAITLDGMVALMLKLSKERGYTVQYGELQRELITGKLKVNGADV